MFFHSANALAGFLNGRVTFLKTFPTHLKAIVVMFVLVGFSAWQVNDYVKHKDKNYFEQLEFDTTLISTMQVKERHKQMMNKIAQETAAVSSTSEDTNSTSEVTDKKKSKKQKKKKKAYKDMTEEERVVADKKSQLKKIYDCLMFSQCYAQYSKYGNYIPLEMAAQ